MTVTPTRPEAGSDFALRALYRDHAAALTSYAAWFTDDRAAAEDAVQETFLRAWRHLPRLLADGRPLRPWLRQVLRHVLVDAARLARTRRLRPLDDTDDPEVDGGYESVLDRGVLARAVAVHCKIVGGVMMQLLGPVPRYATRELQYLGMMGSGSEQQAVSGREYMGVLAKAQDYLLAGESQPQEAPAKEDEKAAPAPTTESPAAKSAPPVPRPRPGAPPPPPPPPRLLKTKKLLKKKE
jgi:RNA polymerase sigma factor (sigma-70 family)